MQCWGRRVSGRMGGLCFFTMQANGGLSNVICVSMTRAFLVRFGVNTCHMGVDREMQHSFVFVHA